MKKISIMISVLVAAFLSCKKTPEVNLKYVDIERDLVTVGTTTANIQCDYDYITTLKKAYFYYGEGEDETDMTSKEMRVVQKTLYVELTGLKENTTYSYYYEFVNGFNSMRSSLKTFKTESGSGGGDEPPTPVITLPTVITASVTGITTNSAQCGGEVTNDGGAEVTERGICWSTNANPTISDSHIVSGSGTGAFTSSMTSLTANTTYHVRAYATNEAGTAYGLDKEFKTLTGGGGGDDVPEGAIRGLFSVSETQQVWFSQGNLQYIGSANTPYWKFADHQWDYFGDNGQGSISPNVDRDLFGWGTSGYDHGAVCYQPWSTSGNEDFYSAYGSDPFGMNWSNLNSGSGQADWGYNPISNGGNLTNQWHTLTADEWSYVFNTRSTASGIRFAMAKVNNVNGVILLPDDWSTSYYTLSDTNDGHSGYSNNTITASQWSALEQYGVVFLPAAGCRHVISVIDVGNYGSYWSASCHAYGYGAYYVDFTNSEFCPELYVGRFWRFSVRLARVAVPVPPTPPVAELPTVITAEVSGITANSAVCGGEVVNDGGAEVFKRGICWSTNANPTLNDSHVAVGTGIGAFAATVSGLNESTTYHIRAYAINEKGTAYGLDKEFKTLIGGGGSDDHEYVDLGLPSGTLWATCNVGANSPEEYGDYFAWGETLPKDTYNWSTYQYCNGDYNQLTKYCYGSVCGYNGFTDDLTVLLPEDDAATANWGEDWRMPFEDEWKELYNNTMSTWTTQNGVNGLRFTASNGNSLFLPASGRRWEDELGYVGSAGRYWSSVLGWDYPVNAWSFASDYWDMFFDNRNYGLSVRPVRSSPQN